MRNSYWHIRKDLKEDVSLSKLLDKLLKLNPKVRFRLSSLHPHEIDDRLVGLWGHPNLCRHLHLSIQSGDDDVLESMGRARARKEDRRSC